MHLQKIRIIIGTNVNDTLWGGFWRNAINIVCRLIHWWGQTNVTHATCAIFFFARIQNDGRELNEKKIQCRVAPTKNHAILVLHPNPLRCLNVTCNEVVFIVFPDGFDAHYFEWLLALLSARQRSWAFNKETSVFFIVQNGVCYLGHACIIVRKGV